MSSNLIPSHSKIWNLFGCRGEGCPWCPEVCERCAPRSPPALLSQLMLLPKFNDSTRLLRTTTELSQPCLVTQLQCWAHFCMVSYNTRDFLVALQSPRAPFWLGGEAWELSSHPIELLCFTTSSYVTKLQ